MLIVIFRIPIGGKVVNIYNVLSLMQIINYDNYKTK